MKKRIFLIFLIILLLTGCAPLQQQTDKTKVVATIFPLYDFAREIAGDDAEVKMLLKPGAEVHSYEPTPQDIIAIQNCDVFLYIGGESDEWVRNVLESIDTTHMQVVTLMDSVEAAEEAEAPQPASRPAARIRLRTRAESFFIGCYLSKIVIAHKFVQQSLYKMPRNNASAL